MGNVIIHQRKFNVDCIIFDKDDTLIEFNPIWGPRTQKWVEAMVASSGLTDAIKKDLFSILGYSVELASARAEGPLAIASIETLCTLAAGTLCQHGIPWHEAQNHAKFSAKDTILAAFDPAQIRPRGDIAKVMRHLAQAKIHIAVVTSDDRQMTEATLAFLGVADLVSIVICGDDPIPNKPTPDALQLISSQLGIETNRIMMIGDTKSDMQFAINGEAAYRIAIVPTIGDKKAPALQADAIIASIDELKVGDVLP